MPRPKPNFQNITRGVSRDNTPDVLRQRYRRNNGNQNNNGQYFLHTGQYLLLGQINSNLPGDISDEDI